MFIQTETTPNPNTIKFLPGCEVAGNTPVDLPDEKSAAQKSPLADRLFKIDGITGVFLGSTFVSVSKDEQFDWVMLKPQILTMLLEHFSNGLPVLSDEESAEDKSAASNEINEDDDEITIQIKELLETRVRPAVAQDGGDIVFQSFDEGIVYLQMRGACAGCPSSTATLKMGIENMLKHYVPEVIEVRPVE
jgi:Fe-S cluster biogenesis protein NfuA